MYTIRAGAVLEATERMVEDNERLLPIEEDIEDVRRNTVNRVDDLAEAFVVHGEVVDVQKFLNGTLADLSAEVKGGGLSRDLSDQVTDDLRSAQSEIIDGDIPKGIENIGDALRHLYVAEYLGKKFATDDTKEDSAVDVTGERQNMESPQVELQKTSVATSSLE